MRCLREPHLRVPSPGAAWRACGRLEEGWVGAREDLHVVEVPRVSQHAVQPKLRWWPCSRTALCTCFHWTCAPLEACLPGEKGVRREAGAGPTRLSGSVGPRAPVPKGNLPPGRWGWDAAEACPRRPGPGRGLSPPAFPPALFCPLGHTAAIEVTSPRGELDDPLFVDGQNSPPGLFGGSSHWSSKERGLTTGSTEMRSCGASSPPGTSRRRGRLRGCRPQEHLRDIAFIVVSAPPPAEQVIRLKDMAPKPESSWRGGLSRTPMCLEENVVVASVQAPSVGEQGVLGRGEGGGVRPLD